MAGDLPAPVRVSPLIKVSFYKYKKLDFLFWENTFFSKFGNPLCNNFF